MAHGGNYLHRVANTGKANWIRIENKNFEVVTLDSKEIPRIIVLLKTTFLKKIKHYLTAALSDPFKKDSEPNYFNELVN